MSKEQELLNNLQDNIYDVDKFIHSSLDLREYCLNNGIPLKDVFVPPMRLFYEIELDRMKNKPKFDVIEKYDNNFISKIEKESYKDRNLKLENEMKNLKRYCFFTCIFVLVLLPFITTLVIKLSL